MHNGYFLAMLLSNIPIIQKSGHSFPWKKTRSKFAQFSSSHWRRGEV